MFLISELVDFEQIKTFNKDNVSNALMAKVKKYVNNPEFQFEVIVKVCTPSNTSSFQFSIVRLYCSSCSFDLTLVKKANTLSGVYERKSLGMRMILEYIALPRRLRRSSCS